MLTQRSEADWMRYLHIKRNESATDQGCSPGISNVCYVLSKIQRLQLQISNSVWEGFVVFWVKEQNVRYLADGKETDQQISMMSMWSL